MKKTNNMKVSSSIVTFRIDIDFEDSEVDMVYKEMMSRGVRTPVPSILTDPAQIKIDKNKLSKTPTEASVDFCLHWLAGYVDRNKMCTETSKWDKDYSKTITVTSPDGFKYVTSPEVKTELEELGIEVTSWYGLMMGTCHLICEVDSKIYSEKLVKEANEIVQKVFNKFVVYYKSKSKKAA